MVVRSGNPFGRVGRRVRQRLAVIAFRVAVAAQAFIAPAAIAQIPCHYDVAAIIQAPDCGIFGFPPTVGTGISPNGEYVCGYYYGCGDFLAFKAFVYKVQTGEFITLPLPPGVVAATAADVNDSGLVAGQYEYTQVSSGPYRGFVYDLNAGQYVLEVPPLPGGKWSAATAINNSGAICGWRSIGPGTEPQTAFYWASKTGFSDFGLVGGQDTFAYDITNDGVVVGTVAPFGAIPKAFVWERSTLTVLPFPPGGLKQNAVGINGNHQIVGGVIIQNGAQQQNIGYVMVLGQSDFLWPPDLLMSCGAYAISDSELVVGRYGPSGNKHACAWRGSNIATDLNSLITPRACPTLRAAVSVSETGWILSDAFDSGSDSPVSVLLRPVPSAIGDTDCNGFVNVDDLLAVINDWGPCGGCGTDVRVDGVVNVLDLVVIIDNWTMSP